MTSSRRRRPEIIDNDDVILREKENTGGKSKTPVAVAEIYFLPII